MTIPFTIYKLGSCQRCKIIRFINTTKNQKRNKPNLLILMNPLLIQLNIKTNYVKKNLKKENKENK